MTQRHPMMQWLGLYVILPLFVGWLVVTCIAHKGSALDILPAIGIIVISSGWGFYFGRIVGR